MERQTQSNSLRDRFGALLRDSRFFIASEVLLLLFLVIARFQGKVVVFLLIGWLSLRLRGSGWKNIGMNRPSNWGTTILISLGISIVYQLFSIGILVPFLHHLTGASIDLSQFDSVRGNYR